MSVRLSDIRTLYANDTLIFGQHSPPLNRLLTELEVGSTYYSMNKNYQECVVNLTTYRKNWNAASNDEISAKRTAGIYLGTLLPDSVGKTAEIQNRLDSDGDQNTCTTKTFLEQSQHKYILGDPCLQFHSQIWTPIRTWNGATDVRWAKRTWCLSNKMPTRNLKIQSTFLDLDWMR